MAAMRKCQRYEHRLKARSVRPVDADRDFLSAPFLHFRATNRASPHAAATGQARIKSRLVSFVQQHGDFATRDVFALGSAVKVVRVLKTETPTRFNKDRTSGRKQPVTLCPQALQQLSSAPIALYACEPVRLSSV